VENKVIKDKVKDRAWQTAWWTHSYSNIWTARM